MGRRIRRLRMRQGLSQRDLAKKAQVSAGLIGQLEAGLRQSVDVLIAVRIAKALRIDVTALVK